MSVDKAKKIRDNSYLAVISILALSYAFLFAYVLIMKYYTFDPSYTVDGRSVSIVRYFINTGTLKISADAAEGIIPFILLCPFAVLSLPFFLPFPYPEYFMAVQAGLMAAAVFPLFYLCRRILGSNLLSLAIIVSYLLNLNINVFTLQGFRISAIAIPFLFALFYYMHKRDKKNTLIFLILANLVIVNVVWMTAVLGLVWYLLTRDALYKLVFKISVVWLAVAVVVLAGIFVLHPETFPLTYAHLGDYGKNLSAGMQSMLSRPVLVLENISRGKDFLLGLFILPPGIFALFSWPFLLPALLETALALIAGSTISTIALVFPFLFLSAVSGCRVFREKAAGIFSADEKSPLCLPLKKGGKGGFRSERFLNGVLSVCIVVVSAGVHYYSSFPQMEDVIFSKKFSFNKYKMTKHARSGHNLLSLILEGTTCLTNPAVMLHLYNCKKVGEFPYDLDKGGWDYIFIDTEDSLNKIRRVGRETDNEEAVLYKNSLTRILADDSEYGVYLFMEGYLLLQKGFSRGRNQGVLSSILDSSGG